MQLKNILTNVLIFLGSQKSKFTKKKNNLSHLLNFKNRINIAFLRFINI